MNNPLILASSSKIRAALLQNAGLEIDLSPVKIDESSITASLLNEGAHARDVADTLAELKAQKAASKHSSDRLVLGCDQVLEHNGQIFSKPTSREEAIEHLKALSAGKHKLLSAAVLYKDHKPVWRVVTTAELYVRSLSEEFIAAYVDQNWDEIQYCVGCYQIEAQGAQLFSQIRGDQFTIMGLPLLELLGYLRVINWMES